MSYWLIPSSICAPALRHYRENAERYRAQTTWMTDLGGTPIHREVLGHTRLIGLRFHKSAVPAGFRRSYEYPQVYVPDTTSEAGLKWAEQFTAAQESPNLLAHLRRIGIPLYLTRASVRLCHKPEILVLKDQSVLLRVAEDVCDFFPGYRWQQLTRGEYRSLKVQGTG